jgi:hypothetical protein
LIGGCSLSEAGAVLLAQRLVILRRIHEHGEHRVYERFECS